VAFSSWCPALFIGIEVLGTKSAHTIRYEMHALADILQECLWMHVHRHHRRFNICSLLVLSCAQQTSARPHAPNATRTSIPFIRQWHFSLTTMSTSLSCIKPHTSFYSTRSDDYLLETALTMPIGRLQVRVVMIFRQAVPRGLG
jgi:hypothetical protein